MKQENQGKQIEYIKLASVLSAIAVVYLHANTCFWSFSQPPGYWTSANIIESVFYFAVPVFFMISGVTLLDYNKKYGLKVYFKKRIHKAVLPYFVWSILGLLIQIYWLHMVNPEDVNLRFVVDGLLNGNLVSIYWFFIPLFAVYFCIPLLAQIPEKAKEKYFPYVIAVGLFFNVICPFFVSVFEWNLHYSFSVYVGAGYIIYIMIGWMIDRKEIPLKWRICIYVISIAGLIIHAVGTYHVSVEAGEVLRTYKGYLTLPCFMNAPGVFLLIRQIGPRLMQKKAFHTVISFLAKYTFPIYLLHWYFLRTSINVLHMDNTKLLYRLIMPWVFIACSIGVTWLLRKCPVIRRIVP